MVLDGLFRKTLRASAKNALQAFLDAAKRPILELRSKMDTQGVWSADRSEQS